MKLKFNLFQMYITQLGTQNVNFTTLFLLLKWLTLGHKTAYSPLSPVPLFSHFSYVFTSSPSPFWRQNCRLQCCISRSRLQQDNCYVQRIKILGIFWLLFRKSNCWELGKRIMHHLAKTGKIKSTVYIGVQPV